MLLKKTPKLESEERNYLKESFYALILILVVKNLWPEVIPFDTFELWKIKQGSVVSWLKLGWPLFAWGLGLTIFICVFKRNSLRVNKNAEKLFAIGTAFSLWAGVMEEICFRWLIFFNAIIAVKLVNYLFFGWLGFGIAEFVQLHWVGPVVDWVTLGYLNEYFRTEIWWAVGAAIISTNAFFRDAHIYLGCIGWVNAWFAGMFLFWVTLNYGLPAAIVIHFTYDFLLDIVCYIDRVIQRKFKLSEGY